MSVMEFKNITAGYGGHTVLDNFSLAIDKGELICLIGPSGCGKTTALRLAGGYLQPKQGQVLIDGVDVTSRPPERRPVSTVFQSYALFPHMTVARNVEYGLRFQGFAAHERHDRALEMLQAMHMDDRADAYPAELSGGQQQRVALARSLVLKPQVLLLDEPLSNLDEGLRFEMREEIKAVQREFGVAMLLVTHDREEAMALGDRIALVHDGHIAQEGNPAHVYDHPSNEYCARFLGWVNVLNSCDSPRYFRVEAVRLGVEGTYTGSVERAIFLGSSWEYFIDVDGQKVRARGDRSMRLNEGDAVSFNITSLLNWKEE